MFGNNRKFYHTTCALKKLIFLYYNKILLPYVTWSMYQSSLVYLELLVCISERLDQVE